MLGPFDRVLALAGIGAYYLHKYHEGEDGYSLEGPYNHPFNPFGDGSTTPGHEPTYQTKYHLMKPEGKISLPQKEKI